MKARTHKKAKRTARETFLLWWNQKKKELNEDLQSMLKTTAIYGSSWAYVCENCLRIVSLPPGGQDTHVCQSPQAGVPRNDKRS